MDRDDPEIHQLWNQFHALVTMKSPTLRDWLMVTPGGVDAYASEPDVDIRALGEDVSRILGKRRVDLTKKDVEAMRHAVYEITELLDNPPDPGTDRAPWRDTLRTLGHDPDGPAESTGHDFAG